MLRDHDIEALVDKQLSPEQEQKVRAQMLCNLTAQQRFVQLERQKLLLNEWFKMNHKSH